MIGRTQSATIEAFTSLEKEVKGVSLFIYQEKTKYMPVNLIVAPCIFVESLLL